MDIPVFNRSDAVGAGLLVDGESASRAIDFFHRPKPSLLPKISVLLDRLPLGDAVSDQLDRAAELDCLGRIAAELMTDRWLSYSRVNGWYSQRKEFGLLPPSVTARRIRRLVDALRGAEFVDHVAGRKSKGVGFQSSIRPAAAWWALFDAEDRAATEADPNAPPVVVKDEAGNPCAPVDAGEFEVACRKVRDLREFMRSFVIEAPVAVGRSELRQVFNSAELDKGGRYYGWWQNLSKTERLSIKLNGEVVVELDYSQNHPSILYHQLGLHVPEAAYTIDGIPRDLVKKTFGRMLNSKRRTQTLQTMAGELGSRELAEQIVSGLEAIHAPLATAGKLWSGVGLELMRKDSQIAVLVMTWALFNGIPLLPVHDSFIVPQSYQQNIHKHMEQSYHAYMGIKPKISISFPT